MGNTKNAKSQPLRSKEYLPKAGPKSSGGGRHQHREPRTNPNEPDLFERARQDRMEEFRTRRQMAMEAAEAKRLQFRKNQAEIAKSLLSIGSGPTRDVAYLVIDNFVVVELTPSQKGSGMTRTSAAELLILNQLTEAQLKNKAAINNGKFAARTVLTMAYKQLTSQVDEQPAETNTLVSA